MISILPGAEPIVHVGTSILSETTAAAKTLPTITLPKALKGGGGLVPPNGATVVSNVRSSMIQW